MMAVCPNCGNQTGEGAVFCDQCGTKLAQPEAATPEVAPAPPSGGGSVICPACGAGNVPGEAFCDFCGSPLEAPVPTAEPTPELEPVSSEAELEVEPAPAPTEEEAEPAAPAPPSAEEPAPSAAEEPAPSEAEGPAPSEVEGPVLSGVEGPVPSAAEGTCPACGAEVQPDEAFCPDCGASLAKAPIPPEPVADVEPVEETPPPPEAAPPAAPVVEEAAPEPVAEEEPAPPPPPPPAPEPPAAPACPACGAEVEAGDAFCSNCGASLQETPTPTPAPAPIPPPAATPTGPRLVVAASGAEIPLPAQDEILIGREDPVSGIYPEIDLTPHGGEEGGVSRRHAKLHVEGDKYFVEDLDSTNFTFVNKQKVAPKTRVEVHDGDEIRCGRVALVLKSA